MRRWSRTALGGRSRSYVLDIYMYLAHLNGLVQIRKVVKVEDYS